MPDPDSEVVSGRRAVLEAVIADRPIRKILLAATARQRGIVREILYEAKRRNVLVQVVTGARLDALAPGQLHQGVIALAAAKATVTVEEILAAARARNEPPLILVADGVQDPANLGAVLRTANGAGVHGVIIPKHRAVGLSSAVAKTSAGAIEYVLVAQVINLVQTVEELKQAGVWIVGLDPGASELYSQLRLVPPLALVVGGEGRGLSRLLKEHCDVLVRLPMKGQVSSLNLAVAVGVLAYDVRRRADERQ